MKFSASFHTRSGENTRILLLRAPVYSSDAFLAVALLVLPVVAADWSPRAAADYLDGRQKEWLAWPASNLADGKKCVSCHTGLT